jgi:hypothetical protein
MCFFLKSTQVYDYMEIKKSAVKRYEETDAESE